MRENPRGTASKRISCAIELAEAASAWSHHRCCEEAAEKLGLVTEALGRESSPDLHRRPKIVLTRKSVNLLFNRVIGLGLRAPATERQLDQAVEIAQRSRVGRFAVDISPFATPGRLPSWLRARGFSPGKSPGGKLWRDDRPLEPTTVSAREDGVTVRRLEPREAGLWVDVVSQVWSTFGSRRWWYEARLREPDWYHYLSYAPDDEGTPIGAGALHVVTVEVAKGERIRVGHLVDGVTLGPYRRLGGQSSVIRRRVEDGLELGCTLFTSETAPPLPRMPLVSYRNLCRQGFELAYLRQTWACG